MRKTQGGGILFFVFIVVFTLSIVGSFGEKMRSHSIGWASYLWQIGSRIKGESSSALKNAEIRIADLQRENLFLLEQVENIKTWLLHKDRIEEEIAHLKDLGDSSFDEKDYFIRRQKQVTKILQLQMMALPAKVIYREPSSWSSFIWLNLGEKQNKILEKKIVAKNSPVVVGQTLVGLVEEVYEDRAKVRLITDSRLFLSVRAIRGRSQSLVLSKRIDDLISSMQTKPGLFSSEREALEFFTFLRKIEDKGREKEIDVYLAKGELYGASLPLWRSRGQLLKGTGFNYDFSDEEGPARDLRSSPIPLLQEGDILITSGLDGVFPAGLEVATVLQVDLLQEGECSYQIKAKPLALELEELSFVFVLPPL